MELSLGLRKLSGGVPPGVELLQNVGEAGDDAERGVRIRRGLPELAQLGGEGQRVERPALEGAAGEAERRQADAESDGSESEAPGPAPPARQRGTHSSTTTARVASSRMNSVPSGPTSSEIGSRTCPPVHSDPRSVTTGRNEASRTESVGPLRSST